MKKLRTAFCCLFAVIVFASLFVVGGCSTKTKYTVQYWTGEIIHEWNGCTIYWSPHETEVEEGRAFLYSPPTIYYTYPSSGETVSAHFQGWYLDTNFKIEFTPSNGIQTDTILYAKYVWGSGAGSPSFKKK